MEYMAMGKPIVAFDLRESRFSAQAAALYAEPNSAEDFAMKIEQLLDDADLRRQMGGFGRKRVEDELSWEHSRKNLIGAYRKLCVAGAQ
jgi:glycosyltransferase involved in cell wall biosynthesis